MIYTLLDQLQAAGGRPSNESEVDVYLLVNNFSEKHQLEASQQSFDRSTDEYVMFDEYLPKNGMDPTSWPVIGFADNRYSNGADVIFCEYISQCHQNQSYNLQIEFFAYAGWNTDGNTLGTVLSNSALLSLYRKTFQPTSGNRNALFNSLRLLEDDNWQAVFRQFLQDYIAQTADNDDGLGDSNYELAFYEEFSYRSLSHDYLQITSNYGVDWNLTGVYYPWNRTFEIGFYDIQI